MRALLEDASDWPVRDLAPGSWLAQVAALRAEEGDLVTGVHTRTQWLVDHAVEIREHQRLSSMLQTVDARLEFLDVERARTRSARRGSRRPCQRSTRQPGCQDGRPSGRAAHRPPWRPDRGCGPALPRPIATGRGNWTQSHHITPWDTTPHHRPQREVAAVPRSPPPDRPGLAHRLGPHHRRGPLDQPTGAPSSCPHPDHHPTYPTADPPRRRTSDPAGVGLTTKLTWNSM